MNNDHLELFLEMLLTERTESINTLDAYKRDINLFLIFLKKNHISLADCQIQFLREYISSLSTYSRKTVLRKISTLKQFFKFLYSEKFIQSNPMLFIDAPRAEMSLPKILTLKQIEILINTAKLDQSPEGIRLLTLIELLYASGLRVSELLSLKLSDLQFDYKNTQTIVKEIENDTSSEELPTRKSLMSNDLSNTHSDFTHYKCQSLLIKGKGNKERIVIINEGALNTVYLYLNIRSKLLPKSSPTINTWLFPSSGSSGHLTRQRFGQIIKQLAIKSNINPLLVSPHVFRHSFASHILEKGANLRLIQELLGHASITSTQIYLHLQSNKLKATVEECHPLVINPLKNII